MGKRSVRFVAACILIFGARVASGQVVPVMPPLPVPTPAPQATPRTPLDSAVASARGGAMELAVAQFRRAGLSDTQIRDRLRTAGAPDSTIDALVGVLANPTTALPAPATTPATPAPASADASRRERRAPSRIFGKDIFASENSAFDPVTSGPVDAAFRLGVGDQLQLVVTGQVELAQVLEVRRDGTVLVPAVGQVPLAGLTLESARDLLKSRMGRSYVAIERGDARVDLSLARLRSNSVFVIGEVENPGARQVSALATAFAAIAAAGGPTERGSFRSIEVRRGGKVLKRLDLYDYLLSGVADGDIRLEQGDVIFVPLANRNVTIQGEIRRNKTFELRDNESVGDLLRYAGGLLPTASLQRIQVDRILPPAQRRAGVERAKVDVELRSDLDSLARVRLVDGDSVTVFAVGSERRNVVKVDGEVYAPGTYQWKAGMTLGMLITSAQGLTPWAIAREVKIVRRIVATGQGELKPVDASTPAGLGFPLDEFDEVFIGDLRPQFPNGKVKVEGSVNTPGEHSWVLNESLTDALRRAGGFKEDAQIVDVFRRRTGALYSDTTSLSFRFAISPTFFTDATPAAFQLQRDDRLVVRGAPGFRDQTFATVTGLFRYPGTYALVEDVDRLKDIVERAGGTLPNAYPNGFALTRKGKPVSVEFTLAMAGDPKHNITLLAGDELKIDRDPKTVTVSGAVSRPSLIRYQPGLTVQDYIELAGGPTENGEALRAVVDYPSGFSRRVHKVAFFFHTDPEVQSGSTITVPINPNADRSFTDRLASTTTTITTLMTLVVTVLALRRL